MLISDGAPATLTYADTTPTFGTGIYNAESGIGLTGYFADYAEIYRRQLWVAVVVNKRASAGSRLPFKVYERTGSGRNDAASSPFGKLMATPNDRMDPKFFWLWTFATRDLFGEALWVKVRPSPGAPPVRLLPLHPVNVYVRTATQEDQDAKGWRVGSLVYVYHRGAVGAVVQEFPESDVVHFRTYNPNSAVRGLSALEPLRQTLVNEDAARRATSSFWQRGARPGFALRHPKELSDGAQRRLKAQFDALHAGADRTGSTLVLEEAMEVEKLDLTAEEAQYIETRKLNREEVCAAYDMPPPVVHILDRATFSNITEQMRSLYRDTMAPLCGSFESTVDQQLRPEFGPEFYGEFLMDEVLRGAFEARMQAYKDAIGFGILEPAEARELENLPDAGPASHRLYINSTMVPLGTDANANPAGAVVDVTPQRIKALSDDQLRSVMGRVPDQKALAELDPNRLVAGLNGESQLVLDALDAAVMAGETASEFRGRLRALAGKDPR